MTVAIALAALVRDGRVLLVHRSASKQAHPDCWDLAGGHVEPGEAPSDAVRRECLEELGVVVHDPVPVPMTSPGPALEVHAFVVTRWDGEPVNAAPDEHDGLAWFAPDELTGVRLAHAAGLAQVLAAADLVGTSPGGDAERLPSPRERRTIGP